MNQRKDAQERLWIRERDSLGNMVDHGLIEAAKRVWEPARLMVIRYLAEDTEAPEILEAAVDSASPIPRVPGVLSAGRRKGGQVYTDRKRSNRWRLLNRRLRRLAGMLLRNGRGYAASAILKHAHR